MRKILDMVGVALIALLMLIMAFIAVIYGAFKYLLGAIAFLVAIPFVFFISTIENITGSIEK